MIKDIELFLTDLERRQAAPKTVETYRSELHLFAGFLAEQVAPPTCAPTGTTSSGFWAPRPPRSTAAWSPCARSSGGQPMNAFVDGHAIQPDLGMDVIPYLTCGDRSILGL